MTVTSPGHATWRLLAVWAFNHRAKGRHRGRRDTTALALTHYQDWLSGASAVVAGDFNNSVVWDRAGKPSNFASVAGRLESIGLVSAYHRARGVALDRDE